MSIVDPTLTHDFDPKSRELRRRLQQAQDDYNALLKAAAADLEACACGPWSEPGVTITVAGLYLVLDTRKYTDPKPTLESFRLIGVRVHPWLVVAGPVRLP